MATLVAHYEAAALTDRGRKRPSNEDAFGFSVEDGVYVVCDGMGGAAAGEIASSLAVDEMLRLFCCRVNGHTMPLADLASEAVCAANHAIYSRSRRNDRLNGMGTTLVGMVVEENRVWVLNIGDSRCYRLRNHRLEMLTRDHSLVEEQIRMGRMTRAEAARSPLRNVITRAVGTQSHVTPDIFELEAEPGDLFLLCSDGLTRELTDAQILAALEAEIGSHPDSQRDCARLLDDLCARLVHDAKKAGGHDNITCLLVRAEG